MNGNQWFAIKRNPSSTVVHLVTGGDIQEVRIYAQSMYSNPVVEKLTWWIMRELTGANIPGDKETTDLYQGVLVLPRRGDYEIMITAL